MSNESIAKNKIEVEIDDAGVTTGIAKIEKSIKTLGKSAQESGGSASRGIEKIVGGSDKASASVERNTKTIIASIQRQIAAAQAGARGTAEYYESIAKLKGVDTASLRPYLNQLKEIQTQSVKVAEVNGKLKTSFIDVGKQVAGVVGIYSALNFGKSLLSSADSITKLSSQLQIATNSQKEFFSAFSNVQEIASKAQSDISSIGTVYARLSNALNELGASQKQVKDLTETLALSLKLNGSTAEETASVMIQLSQAFGKGKLDGDEFKSAMEAAPNVMRELAKSLNVPFGSLKDLASQGKITSDVMLKAFTNPQLLASLNKQAEGAQTVEGGLVNLRNQLTVFSGTLLNGTGISKLFATGIDGLAGSFANLNRQLNDSNTGINKFFPAYEKYRASIDLANKEQEQKKSTELLIPKGAVPGQIYGETKYSLPGFNITAEQVTLSREAKTAYSALIGEVKLLSDELNKQEQIKKNAKLSLEGNLISQADYNKIIVEANEKIKSLNTEKSKSSKLSADAKAQLKIESDYAKNLAENYSDLLVKAQALNAPNENQATQLQRLFDGYINLDSAVKSYVQSQIDLYQTNELEEKLRSDTEAINSQIEAVEKQAQSIEEENLTYGKLPSQIQEVTIARLRDKKIMIESLGLGTEEIEKQISAYQRLKSAMVSREALESEEKRLEVIKKANDEATKQAQKAAEEINRSLTDAIYRGFESGKNFAQNFKQSLINTFKTLVLRPLISFIVDSSGITKLLGSLGGLSLSSTASAAESGGGLTGLLSKGSTSLFDLISKGNGSIVSSIESLGASIANGQGGLLDSIGGFLGGNASSIADGFGYAGAVVSALKGDFKSAALTAAGTAIAGPIGGAIGGLVGGLFGGSSLPPRYTESRRGVYENGSFQGFQRNFQGKKIEGAAAVFDNINKTFSQNLGDYLSSFDINDQIKTRTTYSKKLGSTGSFTAYLNGLKVGRSELDFGKDAKFSDAVAKLSEASLTKVFVSAIKNSNLGDGIKSLFDSSMSRSQIESVIQATTLAQSAQRDLKNAFNLTTDAAARVAGTQGDVVATLNSITQASIAMRTAGENVVFNKDSLKKLTGFDVLPSSLRDFDNILKSIDVSASGGAERFAKLFNVRTLFAQTIDQESGIKAAVKNSIFDLLSPSDQQLQNQQDLAEAFGKFNLAVPSSVEELLTLAKSIDYTTVKGLDLAAAFPSLVDQFTKTKEGVDALTSELNANYFSTFADFKSAQAAINGGQSPMEFIKGQVSQNKTLLDEILRMRQENADLKAIMLMVSEYTAKQERVLDDWDVNGMPAVRAA